MEWLKEKITFIFTRNVSTEQLTMSIVLGITCGVFPIPVLTTAACLISTLFVSVNVPIMTTINLLMTPLELAMIPVFVMAGKYIGAHKLLYGLDAPEPTLNMSAMLASIQDNVWQGLKEFADVLLLAIIAWLIFVPIASTILFYALEPVVAKLMLKFKKETIN
mmetsp:Transcript_57734/g.95802  ORF Transcript_57734/g.95802 Transcript_57734/m.95802 type:complete len:163 (+) Transcript_57734:39-527(+)